MRNPSPAILSVRVTTNERALLTAAADQARTNLSDFIRRKALEAAEIDVLEHRAVTIAAEDWEKFETWATSPAKTVSALQKLSETKPVWEA